MAPKLSEQAGSADDTTRGRTTDGRPPGREALRYIALLVMSAAVGVLVVVAFAGVLNPLVLFGVGMLVGFVAMVTQRSTRATVGIGLYVSALAALLVPLGWYGRSVFAGGGEFYAIEGMAGIVVGLPIAAVIAVVLAVVGFGFRRWAPG